MTIVTVEHPYTKKPYLKTQVCLCKISEMVSNEYPLLSYLKSVYLPFNRIDPKLEFNTETPWKNPNLLIHGDYDQFTLNVKSIIMQHRFDDPKPRFLLSRSIGVLHDFYVQQDDGSSPHLSETLKYDLVIICLDTDEKNDKLKTVISQVVYTRKKERKPTWLYLPDHRPLLHNCTQEYSEELEQNTASFTRIIITKSNGTQAPTSQSDAASFRK